MNDNHHHTNNLASDEQASLLLFKPSVVYDPRLIVFAVDVQSLSCIWLFEIPWTVVRQAFLSFTISWSLLRLISIELVMPSNRLIFCHPFTSCLQSFAVSGSFPMSQLCIRQPNYWSFSFSISLSNEYSELISFRIHWCNLAVQKTPRVFSSTTVRND